MSTPRPPRFVLCNGSSYLQAFMAHPNLVAGTQRGGVSLTVEWTHDVACALRFCGAGYAGRVAGLVALHSAHRPFVGELLEDDSGLRIVPGKTIASMEAVETRYERHRAIAVAPALARSCATCKHLEAPHRPCGQCNGLGQRYELWEPIHAR